MIPTDLECQHRPVRDPDKRSAVYMSGRSLRHERLGYLLQERFPGLLQQWFVQRPKPRTKKQQLQRARKAVIGDLSMREAFGRMRKAGFRPVMRRLRNVLGTRLVKFDYGSIEADMFGEEVESLKRAATVHPTVIESTRDERLTDYLDASPPYFLITFGGPLIGTRILDRVRGLAINQHAGVSPWLKGSHTTEMALYFRRMDLVGSTVHLMDGFADAGDIVRRSLATVHEGDTAAECFLSVTALGNELMLEVVERVLEGDHLDVFPQPEGMGATILNANLNYHRRRDVRRTSARVVREELAELRDF